MLVDLLLSPAGLVALALILDGLFGEPPAIWSRLPHPAILMGRLVAWLDRRLNHPPAQRLGGCLALALLLLCGLAVGAGLAALPGGALWSVALGAALLAQRSLADHVGAVARGLRQGLPEGRQAVAQIVGRDTAEMEPSDVARAAIESAAENLSDGVVAPLFWFLIAGLPGLVIYKLVNTADSMIGYRTERYEEFGWAAARFDDLLNWIPARATGLIIAGISGGLRHWPAIAADAKRHRSPNAGWPEAAAARALGVALAGPRSYHGQRQTFPFVHPEGQQEIGPDQIEAAVALLWRVWLVLLGGTLLLALLG